MCPIFDYPLSRLREYRPPLTRQPDFQSFWAETLREAAGPLNADLVPVDYPVPEVQVFDVRYDGYRGARVGGWYLLPQDASASRSLPAMVFYHGYSGSRAEVARYLPWILQGYAVFAIDVRGQSGVSTDPGAYSIGHVRGWMTQGILDEREYYYRGVYADCVRALDLVCAQPQVDSARIGITGVSQGGGLTLAVGGLDRRPALAMADVPFLCHFERPLQISDAYPYREIADFIRRYPGTDEPVFRTLSYCDAMNLTPDIACPTLVTVGLEDTVCPPSTVFAAYNHIPAPKHIDVFRYFRHEVPGIHSVTKFRWANYYLRGLGTSPLAG
jgi:cephalosporin-C deacetylase